MTSAPAETGKKKPRPSLLTIARIQSGKYRIALDRNDEESRLKPFQESCDVAIPSAVLSHFVEQLNAAILEANLSGDPPDGRLISDAGKGLLDALLPRSSAAAVAVREELAALRPASPLLIATDEPGVPWELLREEGGEDHLGMKFDVGRRLISSAGFSRRNDKRELQGSALIVTNPSGDLPASSAEAQAMRRVLGDYGVACLHLEGAGASFPAILEQLRQGHRLIHFAGHVRYDQEIREYALVLQNDKLFAASVIRSHLRGRPVVFLNGCESASVARGLTDAFLGGGAQAVIGATCRIPDRAARLFAESFYRAALGGHYGVGAALRSACSATKGKSGLGAAWASFVLYGDPTLRIDLSHGDTAAGRRLSGPVSAGTASAGRESKPAMIGPLREAECSPAAWRQLQHAAQFALRSSGTLVTSYDLLCGFLSDPVGPAAMACRKLGYSIAKAVASRDDVPPAAHGTVQCSDNAGKILLMAQAIASAAGWLLQAEDLLEAFVAQGGGRTGAMLRSRGIVVASLTSKLFEDGAILDEDRFDSQAAEIIHTSEDFAAHCGYAALQLEHLLYGLLRMADGALASAIRKQDKDPEMLAELLFAKLPRGGATMLLTHPLTLASLNTSLLEMLCLAERLAGGHPDGGRIGQLALTRAWLQSGGGLGGSFLVRNGVKITNLLE
jgi:hypothetical protein